MGNKDSRFNFGATDNSYSYILELSGDGVSLGVYHEGDLVRRDYHNENSRFKDFESDIQHHFNLRLKENKLNKGKFGAKTFLDKFLYKELVVLLYVLDECDNPELVFKSWLGMRYCERWYLFSLFLSNGVARKALYYILGFDK